MPLSVALQAITSITRRALEPLLRLYACVFEHVSARVYFQGCICVCVCLRVLIVPTHTTYIPAPAPTTHATTRTRTRTRVAHTHRQTHQQTASPIDRQVLVHMYCVRISDMRMSAPMYTTHHP